MRQKRWVKRYKGQRYTISAGVLSAIATREASRQRANEWWLRRRAEIDLAGQPPTWDERQRGIIALLTGASPEAVPLKLPFSQGGKLEPIHEVKTDEIVGAVATSFLELVARKISPATLRSYQNSLKLIREFLGDDSPVSLISASSVKGFHAHLTGRMDGGEMARSYFALVWSVFARFVRHCHSEELLDNLPRNLDTLSIGNETRQVSVFSLDEVRTILEEAKGFSRLCVLLCLNCGMTQADIGNLRQSEVDWHEGRITRKRTKTKKRENAPVVCYKLWDETFALLRQYRSTDMEFVFTTKTHRPLYATWKEGDEVKHLDEITPVLRQATRCVKGKPPKLLRKTGATLLREEYPHFADYFLGHAPMGIGAKHYFNESQAKFDEALEWMRQRIFGQ